MSAIKKLINIDRNMAGFTSTKYRDLVEQATDELAAKNRAIESAIKALRAVVHDRPTAHTDEVWNQVVAALTELETLK